MDPASRAGDKEIAIFDINRTLPERRLRTPEPETVKAHHAGCCLLIPTHYHQEAIQSFEATDEPNIVDELKEHVRAIEEKILKARSRFLKRAIALCEQAGRSEEDRRELHVRVFGHFDELIGTFEQHLMAEEAALLRKHLEGVRQKADAPGFDLKAKLKQWAEQLSREEYVEKARADFFQKAIRKCDKYGDDDARLKSILEEHFNKHIALFDAHNKDQDAKTLKGRLDRLKHHFRHQATVDDIKRKLQEWEKKHLKAKAVHTGDNQVYRVGHAKVTHKEVLPGDFVWETGQPATKEPEVDTPANVADEVVAYVRLLGYDMNEVVRRRISSVGANMQNAYWDGKQIVCGKEGALFKNLGLDRSVLRHEWAHALTDYVASSKLSQTVLGFVYTCEGTCDAGGLNEMLSDVNHSAMAIHQLQPGDSCDDVFLIGKGSIVGDPTAALRNMETGRGWTKHNPRLGEPIEWRFIPYDAWHRDGVVYNIAVEDGLVGGKTSVVDPHWGSSTGNAVWPKQNRRLGIDPQRVVAIHKSWLRGAAKCPTTASYPKFAAEQIAAIRELEPELGMGDRPWQESAKAWADMKVPVQVRGR